MNFYAMNYSNRWLCAHIPILCKKNDFKFGSLITWSFFVKSYHWPKQGKKNAEYIKLHRWKFVRTVSISIYLLKWACRIEFGRIFSCKNGKEATVFFFKKKSVEFDLLVLAIFSSSSYFTAVAGAAAAASEFTCFWLVFLRTRCEMVE